MGCHSGVVGTHTTEIACELYRDIPDPPAHPQFADARKHWTPVISPSGMAFYTGDMFPDWRGSARISGLTARGIVRVTFDGLEVTGEERIYPSPCL